MTQISTDAFNIVKRLKKINPNYAVYFNSAAERFEVHGGGGRGNPSVRSLEFVVPDGVLDVRALNHAMKTHIARADEIYNENELHNSKLEKMAESAMENEMQSMKDMLQFANNTSGEFEFKKMATWL